MCMENVANWNALVTMRQGVTKTWNRIINSTSPLRTLSVMIMSLRSFSTSSTTTSSPSRTQGPTSRPSPRPTPTLTRWTLSQYPSCQSTSLRLQLMMSFMPHISGGRSFMRSEEVAMICLSHFVISAKRFTKITRRRCTKTWPSGGLHSQDARNWGSVRI